MRKTIVAACALVLLAGSAAADTVTLGGDSSLTISNVSVCNVNGCYDAPCGDCPGATLIPWSEINGTDPTSVASVPEAPTLALMLIGFAGSAMVELGWTLRRRQ